MKISVPPILLIAISFPIAAIGNDYDQVRGAQIPRGQDPAVFHYDKMMGALTTGNVRLANAHARARIPHMTLTYRSASFSDIRKAIGPAIQLPTLEKSEERTTQNQEIPPIPKPEIGPIRIELEADPTKEIDQMLKESAEMLEKLLPVESPSKK